MTVPLLNEGLRLHARRGLRSARKILLKSNEENKVRVPCDGCWTVQRGGVLISEHSYGFTPRPSTLCGLHMSFDQVLTRLENAEYLFG